MAAIGIGVVIGLVGGFWLKSKQPNAIWLAPVLAVAGALIASVLALVFGDPEDYGWKEPILQVVLAGAGVATVAYLASKKSAPTAGATAGE
ncbi:MAG: GlsB/YeaQ/YmgE family stress response membrane protein [Natronosporangium sp.]